MNYPIRFFTLFLLPTVLACSSLESSTSSASQSVQVEFGVNALEMHPSENSPFFVSNIEDMVFKLNQPFHVVFRFYWNPSSSEIGEGIAIQTKIPKVEGLTSFFQFGNMFPMMEETDDSKVYTIHLIPNEMNGYAFTFVPQSEMNIQLLVLSSLTLTGKGSRMPLLVVRDE